MLAASRKHAAAASTAESTPRGVRAALAMRENPVEEGVAPPQTSEAPPPEVRFVAPEHVKGGGSIGIREEIHAKWKEARETVSNRSKNACRGC